VKVATMDGSRLSPREQQILARIESSLSQDGHLERELRTLRLSRRTKCAEALRRRVTWVLAVLVLASGLALILVVRTPTAGPVVALTVTCSATLGLSVALLYRRRRRRERR
jgi:Flp pilus assembly protein TadB